MKTVLIDTDIIPDFIFKRDQFLISAEELLKLCELKKVDGFVSLSTVHDSIYFMRKQIGRQKVVGYMLTLLEMLP